VIFTASSAFTPSAEFTASHAFAGSARFTRSIVFTASALFSASATGTAAAGPGAGAQIGGGLLSAGAVGAGLAGLAALAALLLLLRKKKPNPVEEVQGTISDDTLTEMEEYISEYGLSDAPVEIGDDEGVDLPRDFSAAGNYESDVDLNASEHNPDDFQNSAGEG
jgi:hypothetical protein